MSTVGYAVLVGLLVLPRVVRALVDIHRTGPDGEGTGGTPWGWDGCSAGTVNLPDGPTVEWDLYVEDA